ncbi:MAG: hypothetical protein EBS05_19030 [Proteobacteria bacterium]|nr:hypothetical protein [Pseudomonadota bacterium]
MNLNFTRSLRRIFSAAFLFGFLSAAFPEGGAAAASFTKIADGSTAIPNGTGSFIANNFGSPAAYGSTIAFAGKGSSGQSGIYVWDGTTLSRAADLTVAVPNGTGNFTNFSFYDYSVNSSGAVLFRAQGASGPGVYKMSGGTLSRVVDTSFAVPGGTGNFTNVYSLIDSGGLSAFGGQDRALKYGVYTYDGVTITTIANTNTVLPGTSAKLNFTDYVINNNASLAFSAYRSDNASAIYSYAAGALHLIADTNTTVPGTAFKFLSLQSPPNINGNMVTFVGYYNSYSAAGIYGANADGTGLTRLVDTTMTAPGGIGQFAQFYNGFTYLDGTLYFAARTSPGFPSGIYSVTGGTIAKVLAAGDVLDGKTVKSASYDSPGFGGGTMALTVTFTDNSIALYTTAIGGSTVSSFSSQSVTAGGFQLNLSLTAGQPYRLQGTTNLANTNAWVTLTNITTAPATLQYLDPLATNLPFRFYRLSSP